MISQRTSIHILLVLILTLTIVSADFVDLISEVYSVSTSPNEVSLDTKYISYTGGAYLYIRGVGFSTRSFDSNVVTFGVGGPSCTVIEYMTTSTLIVCEAPPIASTSVTAIELKVMVDDKGQSTCRDCWVFYNYYHTPQISYVLPSAGYPGQQISFYGRQSVSSNADIEYLKIGNERCDFVDLIEFDAITYTQPIDDNQAPCNVPPMEAGFYTVSQKNGASSGYAQRMNTLPTYRISDQSSYDFAVVPRIDSISSNRGSTEGQILSIIGEGFSSTSQNEVWLGNNQCDILAQSTTGIQCQLGVTSSSVPNQGYHAGLKFELYGDEDIESIRTGTAGNPVSTEYVLGAEIPLLDADLYGSKLSGYFKPPVSGNYKFVVSADENAELYISTTPLDKTNLQKVCYVEDPTSYKFFMENSANNLQISNDVSLTANNYYYMELYHYAKYGNSFATVGIQVPGITNHVDVFPKVQSIKINCPADQEILEFRLTNVNGGSWQIRFDFLSADGRRIESSSTTGAVGYDTDAANLHDKIWYTTGYETEVTRTLYKADGSSTTTASEATTFVYSVKFLNLRASGPLPVIVSSLTGSGVQTSVNSLSSSSSPLKGTFTIKNIATAKTVQVNFNDDGSTIEKAFITLGYPEDIRVDRTGQPELGSEWRIQFNGNGEGPVPAFGVTHALTGCRSTSSITVDVLTLQANTQNLFYEVIPIEYLFTDEALPQITVKSNGLTGSCPNSNCDYTLVDTNLPEITTATFSGSTLTLYVTNVVDGTYAKADLRVFFANTECTVSTFTASSSPATVVASCQAPEAGDFYPQLHFNGFGYAKKNSGLSQITVSLSISGVTPSQINPNGGSVLTVTGTGFPASLQLAQARSISIKIGSSDCVPSSITATQIQCTTTAVSGSAPLTVTLNGKTGSSSALSLLSNAPAISTVSPSSVNPVLQTDITITGTGFDSSIAQTKIYIANDTNSQVQECLAVSSSSTQITCKLLGAPTGNYKFYVKTSLGYSNSVDFAVKTVITSVSPSSGSAAGGTLLTIQGGAFSDITQQTLVFIGDGNVACDVISSSSNQVTCLTQPRLSSYGETAQYVYVDTRIVEEAVCEGGDACKFTYLTSLTPVVTGFVGVNSTVNVPAGGSLQITGSGFDSVPAGTDPIVTINGFNCPVTSSTATQITVTIPSDIVPSTNAVVVVTIPGKGYAKFNSDVSNQIRVAPSILSSSPGTGSTAGTLVTIVGAGFQDGSIVKIGSQVCEIRSLTATQIICKGTNIGDISITYGGFTNIQCTGSCRLVTYTSQTPTVASVSPTAPTSSAFALTIQGTLFTLSSPVTVKLVSQTDKTLTFEGSVTSSTATQVVVSFTNVPGGTYGLEVLSGKNIASSSATVSVPISASVSASVQSSIAGGAVLTIAGAGFFDNTLKDNNKVSVCGFSCPVTESTPTQIKCLTPMFLNAAVRSTYTDLGDVAVFQGTTWSDAGTESTAFDTGFSTSYKSTRANCEIGIDVGANLLGELTQFQYYPDPSITASTLSNTVLEGSNNKISYTLITTIDQNAHDGWNSINYDDTPIRYRYYRVRGATSTAKCAFAELQFIGVVLANNTATDLNAIDCTAKVTVNDKTQETSATAVNYRQSQTPVLTSISPDMGTTAGGTVLTLTGTGFTTVTSKIKVYIDDIECTVSAATSTQITCQTGAAPSISNRRSSLESELVIKFQDQGYVVTNNTKYFYIDRWSDISTWGGIVPPREGETVSIPAGQTILLDISPPKLKAIIVEGALIFEDTNIDLHCEYIIVRNGRLQIGTEDKPIQSKITVTLYGRRDTAQLPTFGNKVIALMEGILDIHGKPRTYTWTVLDRTVNVGGTSIVVTENVDWAVGEQIVIASSDHDHYQSESRTIATVAQNTPSSGLTTITFTDALKYKHYAGIQTFDGQTFEMRAEVGLLTRNVVIQGDDTSEQNKYGCQIMTHSPGDDSSVSRISYTEVRQAGQAYVLGRYPIHFHMIGNVRQSYVIGNSVHHTYNRAITIHGVHFLKVQKNVAYWTMGHSIFIEDGIETHNVIEDNLVINTIASMSLLSTDQTPASFWITHPTNTLRRNHAAGSDRYGFWFDLKVNPDGPSTTYDICPRGEVLGEFTDNQAHSNGRYGLRVFHELIPRTYPCQDPQPFDQNPPIPAEFTNFLSWKNKKSGVIGERLGAVKFKNIKTADNLRSGIEISEGGIYSPPDTMAVENAWIVGMTPDNSGDLSLYESNNVRGLITSRGDSVLFNNVHFYHFGFNMTAIETCSHCEHEAATTSGAKTNFFQGLKFQDVMQRVRFNMPYKEILVDKDGSLTGNTAGGKGVVTYFYDYLNVDGCTRNEAVYNGLVCDETVTMRRGYIYGLQPTSSFAMMNWTLTRVDTNGLPSTTVLPYWTGMSEQGWAAAFVTGYNYNVSWNTQADFTNMTITPSNISVPTDKTFTLVFNYTEYRDMFSVTASPDTSIVIGNTTTLWDSATTTAVSTGDWYHDMDNKNFFFAFNGKRIKDYQVLAIKCSGSCPVIVPSVPKEDFIRPWSNATQWPNQQLPQDGDDVEVPGDWNLLLDINTASLGTLTIKGDLTFDSTKDNLVLTAQRIWVQGQLLIGNSTSRYTKNAKIVLTGSRTSNTLLLGAVQNAGNKVLAVTGNLTIYGALVQDTFVRLQAPALRYASTITLPSDVDWQVGDEIFLAPSQIYYKEYETRTIQSISNGVVTLDQPLSHDHFGATEVTKTTAYGTIDMRTEVGLLTRNVVIEGTSEGNWGGRVYVAEIYDATYDYYYRGRVDLDGVELKNIGQQSTEHAGLTFDLLTTTNNDRSVVRRSVLRDSLAWLVSVINSTGLTFEENVLYNAVEHSVIFSQTCSDIQFNGNLLVGTEKRGLVEDEMGLVKDYTSAFFSQIALADSNITENIVAGCHMDCFIVAAGDCSNNNDGPYTFRNNIAHSGETGWVAAVTSEACTAVTDFIGYKLEGGVVTYGLTQKVKGSGLVVTDSIFGASLDTGLSTNIADVYLTDSYFAGLSLPLSSAATFYPSNECSNLTGVYIAVTTIVAKKIPPVPMSIPWYAAKHDPVWKGTFYVDNVVFENFNDAMQSGCTGNRIFQTNPGAMDASTSTYLTNINLINIGEENKILFLSDGDGEVGIDNCGGWFCTGFRNLILRDLDGSFIGYPASIFPINPTILDSSTCTESVTQNSYVCEDKGWGLLTFESMDSDARTRLISPVYVTSDNYQNTLNSYEDQNWDGFYTGFQRMSRFHSVVQSGKDYKVAFSGTIPNGVRWELQGAASSDYVTVEYGYLNPQSVRFTDMSGNLIAAKVVTTGGDNVLKSTDPCGTNIYDLSNKKLHLKLTGDQSCQIAGQLTNSIRASVRYEISIDEFFNQNGAATFVDKVAAILGINPASIRIVEILSGSTVINFFIDSTHQGDSTEEDLAAKAELNGWITTLTNAVSTGDLKILNSNILNSSFDISLVREHPDTIESSNNTVIIVIAAVVGTVALLIGSFFAYKKYTKKRIASEKSVKKIYPAPRKEVEILHSEMPLSSTFNYSPANSLSPAMSSSKVLVEESNRESPIPSPELDSPLRGPDDAKTKLNRNGSVKVGSEEDVAQLNL